VCAFFFFQAEDGIRDRNVTGVQTCALPISQEIREFLIEKVSATGGHLGPNLGVVELTMALHRVFDAPSDPLIFDTGHQAYVHKILRSEEHTSELQSRFDLVCRLLLEKKNILSTGYV